jgi:tight adherence protein C
MMIAICTVLFALLMIAISAYGYRRYAKPARFYEQLDAPEATIASPLITGAPLQPKGAQIIVKVVRQIGEKVPVSPESVANVRRYLIAAGYRSDIAIKIFYGIRVVGCVVLPLIVFSLRDYISKNNTLHIAAIAFAGFAGYLLPQFVLEKKIKARQEEIRMSLPDALDLLVVCVEAGLGLDQAISHVSRELHLTHPAISEELGLVTLEMRAGKRRAEALRNLADRSGEPELRKLIATLIQSDRFGTSVAESLRTHSDFMRVRRKQDAEERAGKVGVKLVFPIFFFILPSMLVVAAGPALLQVFKYLFPMMKKFSM